MIRPQEYKHILLYAHLLLFFSTHAATRYVTNLLDNGSPGSLRKTIEAADIGDSIKFSVSGTITLDPARSTLVIDKKLTIDGENKITIDGGNNVVTGILITGSNAAETILTNVTISQFRGVSSTDIARGILIENGAVNCSIIGCTVERISSDGESQLVEAIKSSENMVEISDCTIQDITAEGLIARSVAMRCISMDFIPLQRLCNNTITRIHVNSPNIQISNLFTVLAAPIICTYNNISDIRSEFPEVGITSVFGLVLRGSAQMVSYNTVTDIIINSNSPGIAPVGILLPQEVNQVTHNTVTNFFIKMGGASVRLAMYGIFQDFDATAYTVAYNTISNLVGVSNFYSKERDCGFKKSCSFSSVESSAGFFLNGAVTGNVVHNNVCNFKNDANATSNVFGIYSCSVGGVCANNTIDTFVSGNVNAQLVGGLYIPGEQENQLIVANNTINNLSGINEIFGISVGVDSVYLCANTVETICSNDAAHGIIFDVVEQVIAEHNIVSGISAKNNEGFGITFESIPSLGIKLLSNRIFNIKTKTFNFQPMQEHDALVILKKVRCSDGCKVRIEGTLIPMSEFPDNTNYLIQFFASDSDMPEQLQTLIADYIHSAGQGQSFSVTFSAPVSLESGQFITATATALVDQNVSTSDVSNAVPGCTAQAIFCECPPGLLVPDQPCLNVYPCHDIL